jgi:hypothetical protein
MDAHAKQASNFFDPALVVVPQAVHVFTALRQGAYDVNELNYPELSCRVAIADGQHSGDLSSKLTAALSVHIDGFLALSSFDVPDEDGAVIFSARFSNLMTRQDVEYAIASRAADIIDTLMALD